MTSKSLTTPLWLQFLVFLASLVISTTTQADSVYQQRADYRIALDHLTAGRMDSYRKYRRDLDDYVLAPYLDYYELQSRISKASSEDVTDFRQRYVDLPVADIVYYRWLKRLGSQRKWETYLDHYEPSENAQLRCYYLRSLYGTGERTLAFEQVPELWISAKSQPKACDPLFDAWINADQLTESMVWDRLDLAIRANQRTLARYLLRFFTSPVKSWAQSYYNVHVNPSSVARTGRFQTDNGYARIVIAYGVQRLAEARPDAASKAWLQYSDSHEFDLDSRRRVDAALLVGHAREGEFPVQVEDPELAAMAALKLSEAAIANESWSHAAFWVDQLDIHTRSTERWQYWLARALASSTLNSERAQLTYAALAQQRNYYGFLAAERLGRPVQLNHRPSATNSIQINMLQSNSAIQRAIELYAVDDQVNARREWNKLLPQLNADQLAAAAALAAKIGWTSQSVLTANDDTLQDTLELRFPIAYPDTFRQVSHATAVPESFLYAIARQESVFNPDARSPANARGLMQLMHPTAESVARRTGLKIPSSRDLYDPALNVEIAGHYLASLLLRYDQRRPLAAAAYNAGESRVDRWIRDASGTSMDVWIETIPFKETRNYVKGVLAFSQVYSQLLGTPLPMLQVNETEIP